MKIHKSQVSKMKYQALYWLRIKQRCMFIATEAGEFSADVLGINEEKMIEVEVKVTMQDFKNDFKKYKHDRYSGYWSDGVCQWVPNRFYYAVPEKMVPAVKQFLLEKSELGSFSKREKLKDYGIIQLEGWEVIKRAGWLHKNKPTNRVKCALALRMGSELLRFQEAWL